MLTDCKHHPMVNCRGDLPYDVKQIRYMCVTILTAYVTGLTAYLTILTAYVTILTAYVTGLTAY